MISHVIVLN